MTITDARDHLLTELGYTKPLPETRAGIVQGGSTALLRIYTNDTKPTEFPISDLTDRQRAALDALMKAADAKWPFGEPTP